MSDYDDDFNEPLEFDELHYEDTEENVNATFGPNVTLVQTVRDGDHGKRVVRKIMPAYFAVLALQDENNGKSVMSAHIEWGKHIDRWSY